MHIGMMIIEFFIEGCNSLKEKRRRMSGIRVRFGSKLNIAVCESNYQDMHQKAEWTFVAVANDSKSLNQTFTNIENQIESNVDALLTNIHREEL